MAGEFVEQLKTSEKLRKELQKRFWAVANVYQMILERLYRDEVGRRPPGSNRTSRLRKKRCRALMAWWESTLTST